MCIFKSNKPDYEGMKNFLLGPEINVVVVPYSKILQKISVPGVDVYACTFPTAVPHNYTLHCDNKQPSFSIYTHELLHVCQMERGDLKISNDYKTFIWKGQEYPGSTPYFDRPWEIEVNNQLNEVIRSFKHSKKQLQ